MSINTNSDYPVPLIIGVSTYIGAILLYKFGKKKYPDQPDLILHDISKKIREIANKPFEMIEERCKKCILYHP